MASFSNDSYRKKVESIFTRFPSVQKVTFKEAYKPGLEHMVDFSDYLGNPHTKYMTIHVGGTNGKGSVSNMLASALSAAGLKVGLYTSPHILDFRERMRIIDAASETPARMVSREYVYDFLCSFDAKFSELDLSFFEITTGMAFKWFADEQVDVAVIEVGLGGRLDSTNIIRPELSIITSIALDHCALLATPSKQSRPRRREYSKAGFLPLPGSSCPRRGLPLKRWPLASARCISLKMRNLRCGRTAKES
jgi:folylpolyglutamate synthase/dihydrofolate synthase